MMHALPDPAQLFVLQDEETVRFNLPPLPIATTAKPLRVHLDIDSESVEPVIAGLVELRKQMRPAPM